MKTQTINKNIDYFPVKLLLADLEVEGNEITIIHNWGYSITF